MAGKQKLELTWIGKENRPRLKPRILLEDAEKSHHAKQRVTENDSFDNRLIFGDNLLALKALKEVAVKWCTDASDHASSYGGKPWSYLLIPHDEIAENKTLIGLAAKFGNN